ncbi:MAG: Uma2 family endonuclease [Pyrinomonadaceae bacterium]
MSLQARKRKFYTPEEYLALEEKSEFRSEYVDGYIYKLAGGTEAHNDITLNIASQLKIKLRGRCKTFANDMKVWVEEAGTFFYPDVTVVCGERKFYRDRCDIVENPILLIEVLSKSTDEYDKNDKFLIYRNIPSFQEYVLISQNRPAVQQFNRQADGKWLHQATIGLNSKVYFESVDMELSLEDIYDLVEFEENNQ